MIGRHQRSRLLHMMRNHFAKSGLKQMSRGVVAHSGLPDLRVDDGIDFLPDPKGAPPFRVFCGGWGFHHDLMRTNSLDRVIAGFHVGDDGVVIVAVEPSAIADLSSGFGIEWSVVEDDLTFFSWLEFLRALTVVDDGENFAAVGAGLAVALEFGFGKPLVGGIGGLLGCALPGGASAFALLLHDAVEACLIEIDAGVANRVLDEIQGKSESVV